MKLKAKKIVVITLVLSLLLNTVVYAATTTGSTVITSEKTITATALDYYTVTWSGSLSRYGSYLGSTTSGSRSKEGWKSISYTDRNGNTQYANPYQSGSIQIKVGTSIVLRMISGSGNNISAGCYSSLNWIINGNNVNRQQNGVPYSFFSASYTPNKSGTLTIYDDNIGSNLDGYGWYINYV